MEKSNYIYRVIEGTPKKEILNELLSLYAILFEDVKLDFFIHRTQTKEDLITILCYDSENLIGFKLGYRYDKTTLYSWVGGILSTHRKQGIAQQLMTLQHSWAKEKNYQKVRTKSMNRFKPMIILNLKNGFDIVKVYTNDSQQTKIIFEKKFH